MDMDASRNLHSLRQSFLAGLLALLPLFITWKILSFLFVTVDGRQLPFSDGMTLRERGMIFVMAAVVLFTLINTALIEPLLAKQKRFTQQITQQESEIKGIQAQVQALAQARVNDSDGANRAKLITLKQQLLEVRKSMQAHQAQLVAPGKIAGLLKEMLARNGRVNLVGIRNLAVTPLLGEDAQSPTQSVAPADAQIFKHGVEMTVSGNYLDILNYLRELEKLPWQLFWGSASLRVGEHPNASLVLTIYTLSLERAWLTI